VKETSFISIFDAGIYGWPWASANCFTKDLVINGKDVLVSSFGDIDRIQEQMSESKWPEDFKS